MEPLNPDYRAYVREIFSRASFVRHLGIELLEVQPGYCRTLLDARPELSQQHGYVHAGVLTTLADHTAGGAGGSLIPTDHLVLSIDLQISFLRPARTRQLACEARVARAGRDLIFAQSTVTDSQGGGKELCRASVVLAVVAS